jgi:hypothetical protein
MRIRIARRGVFSSDVGANVGGSLARPNLAKFTAKRFMLPQRFSLSVLSLFAPLNEASCLK